MNKLISFAVLTLAATSSLAATDPVDSNAAQQYQYGMQLDIAKVVSITPSSSDCGVVPATMVYQDHDGETHQLQYKVMNDCWQTN